MNKKKLYVWRNVLCIVGDGVIAVMAESEDAARETVRNMPTEDADGDELYGAFWVAKEIENLPPTEVHEEPVVIWCVGSE